MLHWLKKQYLPYLLLYVAILCVVVFLVLYGIFKLLPSKAVFSLDIGQIGVLDGAVFSNAYDVYAVFYGDKIDFISDRNFGEINIYPRGEMILVDRAGNRIQIHENDQVRIPNSCGGNFYVRRQEDYSSIPFTSKPNSFTLPLVSMETEYSFSPTLSINRDARHKGSIILQGVEQVRHRVDFEIVEDTEIVLGNDTQMMVYFANDDAYREPQSYEIKRILLPTVGAILKINLPFVKDSEDFSYQASTIQLSFDELEIDYNLISSCEEGSADITGDGTLYYSSYTNDREYPLHMQKVHLDNTNLGLTVENDGADTSIKVHGSADDILRSGVSLEPSILNWLSENVAILPTFLLTVFGGAITISLKMWDKANAKTNVSKPEACPYFRRPASIYARRKAKADREKRIVTSADASSQ